MIRASRLVLRAQIRRIDLEIDLARAVNDKETIKSLQQQRHRVAKEICDLIFLPCIARALKAVENAQ